MKETFGAIEEGSESGQKRKRTRQCIDFISSNIFIF